MDTLRPGVLARRVVLGLSAVAATWGLFHIGRAFVVDGRVRFGNPVSQEGAPRDELLGTPPLSVKAEVTRAQGDIDVRPGQLCNFFVERRPRDPQGFYCNAQVMCGGKLLYGGLDRGYFTCRFHEGGRRDVEGSDPGTTREDKDASLRLDTRTGVLRIRDDETGPHGAFELEAEVVAVH